MDALFKDLLPGTAPLLRTNGTPNASYSITLSVLLDRMPEMLGTVTSPIGAPGGWVGEIDLAQVRRRYGTGYYRGCHLG